MLDQIDISIEVPRVDYEKLSSERRGESSEQICARGEVFTFQLERVHISSLNSSLLKFI
jgi:magnesium chelatase family protein